MPTLAPTVHERLARCGTHVYVDGLVLGADVVLSVDGVEISTTAASGGHSFSVASLNPGVLVKAKQDAGSGFSPWSPAVVVEDAVVPPNAAPHLPAEVGSCSHCVRVSAMVPGCEVELYVGTTLVGKGAADRGGAACVAVDLSKVGRERATLSARMLVCGQPGPFATTPIVPQGTLPEPVVGSPLFGCQAIVPLSELQPGARVRLESDGGDFLGWFCSCWTGVNVRVLRALITGERVRAQGYFEGAGACKAVGPWSDWQLVIAPDETITPVVLEPLIEGDQIIRVDNQIVGATLLIRIRPTESDPAEEFGPRPASEFQEIALNAPLAAGNVVSVVQTLCGVSFESAPVTVLPLPPEVFAPLIVPPLYACAGAVQVSNLHAGAVVRLYQDAIPIGLAWAGLASSISVACAPVLVAGAKVTATQTVGSIVSPESEPVEVLALRSLQRPRILRPVALDDTTVWVTRVTPGARVRIRSGTTLLGEAIASEPIVRVPVTPVPGPIRPSVHLCSRSRTGAQVTPVTEPCAGGIFPGAGEEFLKFKDWAVPATADGAAFSTRMEGQIYFPATAGGKLDPDAQDLPLVVIAHGYWPETYYDEATDTFPEVLSYIGYDYLARHLARWGMLVFSLRMDDVNNVTASGASNVHQYSRAEIILHAIDELLAHRRYASRIDRNRIGLIGHSMGGEGVVVAQFLNQSEARGYGIRGVVSIAPTQWRPEVILRGVKYLQLLGSMDILTRSGVTGPDAPFSGVRIYDRAWRPKTHFWIHGARHNPFNRRWVATGDNLETGWADLALPLSTHERIARCLINAFFQDALHNQSAYAGYMEGTILPRSIAGLEIHTQFSAQLREVVDNCGDLDEQALLPDEPLDKNTNSRGQAVSGSGPGLGIWDDVEHTALSNSPHQTKGVELSWNEPDAQYLSQTGGIASTATRVIALRAAQFYEDVALNPVDVPVDLFVVLSDGVNQRMVRLGAVARIPYPDAAGNVLSMLRTVRLPLDAFLAVGTLNLASLQSVTLRLVGRPTGHLLADDIEIGA